MAGRAGEQAAAASFTNAPRFRSARGRIEGTHSNFVLIIQGIESRGYDFTSAEFPSSPILSQEKSYEITHKSASPKRRLRKKRELRNCSMAECAQKSPREHNTAPSRLADSEINHRIGAPATPAAPQKNPEATDTNAKKKWHVEHTVRS